MDVISMERTWEDEGFFEIEIFARSTLVQASAKSYTTTASISELASKLSDFPKNFEDRYIWRNGTEGDGSTPFVSLEFWNADKLGHIVVEVYMEIDDGASYSKHNCCFFINTEAGLLNSFGRALLLLNEKGVGRKIELSPSAEW